MDGVLELRHAQTQPTTYILPWKERLWTIALYGIISEASNLLLLFSETSCQNSDPDYKRDAEQLKCSLSLAHPSTSLSFQFFKRTAKPSIHNACSMYVH